MVWFLWASASFADDALVWEACGWACGGSTNQIEEILLDAGADSVDVVDELASADGYRLIVVTPPVDGITSAQRDELVEHVDNGGFLLLCGDQGEYFGDANDALNEVISDLGLLDRIALENTKVGDSGCLDATSDINHEHPFADGVAQVEYNWSATIDAGADEWVARIDEGVILAAAGRVVLSGDSGFVIDTCEPDFSSDGNARLFRNLWSGEFAAEAPVEDDDSDASDSDDEDPAEDGQEASAPFGCAARGTALVFLPIAPLVRRRRSPRK